MIKNIIADNAYELLGLKVIATDFIISDSHNKIIDIIGYDENNQLVIIEFRSGKYGPIISKSLMYIDYIVKNPSQIKLVINEKLGYDLASSIYLNPRLISIGDDFNQYDEYAIKQTPYMIDLIKYQIFNNKYLLLEKNYQSKKIDQMKVNPQEKTALSRMICDYILSLGDEVCEIGTGKVYTYRKIRNFAYLFDDDQIELRIHSQKTHKTFIIKNRFDFEKRKKDIENGYDFN
ncbi:MAG: hypothetical protein M0R05_01830 [Bacilli bacterium]|nr:hypothetical protein [Bacilli bacterium]